MAAPTTSCRPPTATGWRRTCPVPRPGSTRTAATWATTPRSSATSPGWRSPIPAADAVRAHADLPSAVGGIPIPGDTVSRATWAWAQRRLPRYLLAHSVRAYCWGATLAEKDGLAFDAPILWSAALIHDAGLTQPPPNRICFEYQGGEIARRLLVVEWMARDDARSEEHTSELQAHV